jgi:hypothetical protein
VHLFPRSYLQKYEVEKLGFPHKTLVQGVWNLLDEMKLIPEERRSHWHNTPTRKFKFCFCKILIFHHISNAWGKMTINIKLDEKLEGVDNF